MKASKLIAAFMAVGLFITSTGCTTKSDKAKEAMEGVLDSYMSKVLSGKDASKYVDSKKETEISFYNERKEYLDAVLSVSDYEIVESEVDLKYKEGTVTVELQYPDAETIAESYFDVEFEDYIEDIKTTKSRLDKKIKIGFVLKDGEWLVSKKADKKFKETLESLVENVYLEPYYPGPIDEPAFNMVGISFPTQSLQRWERDAGYLAESLVELGYKVDVEFANNDINTQITQIQSMISLGCKVIIVAAIESQSLKEVLSDAKDAGITVIAYDRMIMDTSDVDYYVTFDNYAVGVLQAEYIVAALGLDSANNGKVYNIELTAGDPGDYNAAMFYEGAYEVLAPYIDRGVVQIPSGQVSFRDVATASWSTQHAQERAENIITTYYSDGTPIDAWLCSNDSTALGVEFALEAYYTGTYPYITGQDCDIACVKNILQGKQAMSVFKDTRTLVDATVKMTGQIINGETVSVNDTTTYDNGVIAIPTYLCDPIFVDASNYKEILIDSGYYTMDQLK